MQKHRKGSIMVSRRQKQEGMHAARSHVQEVSDCNILVIGEVSQWSKNGRTLPQSQGVHCIEFHQLGADTLALLDPSAVFSPILCASFDCLDLAVMLQTLGFKGRYRAMGENLPNPHLVLSEINDSCPNIDFDIVHLGYGDGMVVN